MGVQLICEKRWGAPSFVTFSEESARLFEQSLGNVLVVKKDYSEISSKPSWHTPSFSDFGVGEAFKEEPRGLVVLVDCSAGHLAWPCCKDGKFYNGVSGADPDAEDNNGVGGDVTTSVTIWQDS